MIYEKLPVVLFSALSTYREDETNHVIATYILNHIDEVKDFGIKDLAQSCHVGTGSISRFCREIGFNNFAELKKSLHDSTSYDDSHFSPLSLSDHINQAINIAAASIDRKQIYKLIKDIQAYDHIYAFGLLKAQNAANDFVVDMHMLGVEVRTSVSYASQIDTMMNVNEKDLVIVFSYTGTYFDAHIWRKERKILEQAKIWMIMGGQHEQPSFVDEVIRFDSSLDQRSHPYQLEYIANLITETYAKGE